MINDSEPGTQQRLEVLVICDTALDSIRLQSILGHTNWVVHCTSTLQTAANLLQSRSVPVVVCAAEVCDGTWEDALEMLRELSQPLKLVVYTGAAGERLWPKILDSGAYDVLGKPFQPEEMFEVVSSAYRAWDKESNIQQLPTTR